MNPLASVNLGDSHAVQAVLNGVKPLPIIDTAAWCDKPAPERMWLLDQWIPLGRGTFLTGRGGANKSLLTQQLATMVSLGLPFAGVQTRRMNALYVTCEDDQAELHRRQQSIFAGLSLPRGAGDERMFLLSLNYELAADKALIVWDGARWQPSDLYKQLVQACKSRRAGFLVLDNVSHLCPGYSIDEAAIGTFCDLMERLAVEIGGAVLFIGHPPKNGSEFSGLQLWENRVRARLFLDWEEREAGSFDPDVRVLKRSKSNYSKTGETIRLRFADWFLRPEQEGGLWGDRMAMTAEAAAENARFLECLDKATSQHRALSHSPHAQNFAPKFMPSMTAARGMKADAFRRAMERLFELGEIAADQPLWKGADRKDVRGLARAGRLRDGCDEPSRTLFENGPDHSENGCGTVPPEGGAGRLRGGLSGQDTQTDASPSNDGENVCGTVAGRFEHETANPGGGGSPPKGGFPPHSPDDVVWEDQP